MLPHQVHNINDKSVTSWRGQKSVVCCVVSFLPNSITITCCRLGGRVANKSVTSFSVYGETCVMDFVLLGTSYAASMGPDLN